MTRQIPDAAEIIASEQLSGRVGFALADAITGEMIEVLHPLRALPPASTAKALTALYALENLGPDYRFSTRTLATGPLTAGRLEGDLVLAGGGDPVLDTDALWSMVEALHALGLREIAGGVKVWTSALPRIREIDSEQPDQVGYNPAVGGLNLNFNRVHFGWSRNAGGYTVSMDGRSETIVPPVRFARMEVIDRGLPIYTYAADGDIDRWTVAQSALGRGGARWLPVRVPGLYAGEVLQQLLLAKGIGSNGPVERTDAATGTVLHTHDSPALSGILRGMLQYSTNLTAEVTGLTASLAAGWQGETLADSAGRMNSWLSQKYGLRRPLLEDHSGLGDDSALSPADMVRAMSGAGWEGPLRPLLRQFDPEDDRLSVSAKTGTLNFVSGLAGYLEGPRGKPLAFSIFCADLPRRDSLSEAERERPDGGIAWNKSAKRIQRAMLQRWGALYLLPG
ncbi:D-alanyl-D-alanine carboxypeptidase/D-alanyl-D-alanine endopeptidase [Palleronia caenipelagi]|uniref:D-alanyl-D-alanine carboxypeptidase/D-alanyl-D-alanine endopeptidase n=1 Tax=Palleronia caenipelagi TaxID=2489174 RepID=UPI001FE96776|nr:D-alanyl-D-alanine carboxypeptidase/D-alanyl-D-alanine-endopeptidase [Palleronia caenipelagi]